MPSFSGLISGALKGAAKGVDEVATSEMDKQQKLDYQRQYLQMLEEKELRVDDIRRTRDVQDIGRKAQANADADLATAPTRAQAAVLSETSKIDAASAAGLPSKQADYEASAAAAKVDAKTKAGLPAKEADYEANAAAAKVDAKTKAGLPEKEAGYKMSEWEAQKDQRAAEQREKVDNAKKEVIELGNDKQFLRGTSNISVAKSAGDLAEIRERGRQRGAGGSGAGDSSDKPANTADIQRQIDAARQRIARELDVNKNDLNAEIGSLRRKAANGDQRAKEKLDRIEGTLRELEAAEDRMLQYKTRKQPKSDSATPEPTGSKERKPLDSFQK